jgi:biopolymer transport protein ExbD
MDVLLRVDVAVLALLLACTIVLVVRVSRWYRLARHRGIDDPAGKSSVAKLKASVDNLKSIAFTAPYFGLVGTCLGILSAFSGIGMEIHAYLAWVTSKMAAALVPCATGIIVAIPATCAYEYGRARLDLVVNRLPRRNRLPTRHFTELPSFALVTAWLFAILIRVYALPFTPFRTWKGLDVGIASVPCDKSERFIVLRISAEGGIFLNYDEVKDWMSLQSRLSEIYEMRAHRVLYLSADEGVPFQAVVDATDTVKSTPENISVELVTARAVTAGCSEPRLVGGSRPHSSRYLMAHRPMHKYVLPPSLAGK